MDRYFRKSFNRYFKGANGFASCNKLALERLEDRRVLTTPAVGLFTRIEGLGDDQDLYAIATANAQVPSASPPVGNNDTQTQSSDTAAYAARTFTVTADGGFASATAHALSQIPSIFNEARTVPVTSQVTSQIVQATKEDYQTAIAGATVQTGLRGDFVNSDPDFGGPAPIPEKAWWGAVHLLGIGDGIATGTPGAGWAFGSGSFDPFIPGMRLQIYKNYTELLVDITVISVAFGNTQWLGGTARGMSWQVFGQMVDEDGVLQPINYQSSGLNALLRYTTEIEHGDVLNFTTQWPTIGIIDDIDDGIRSTLAAQVTPQQIQVQPPLQPPEQVAGPGLAEATFAQAINTYGFAYRSGDMGPQLGIITGPGGSAPGDINGDGFIDGTDGAL